MSIQLGSLCLGDNGKGKMNWNKKWLIFAVPLIFNTTHSNSAPVDTLMTKTPMMETQVKMACDVIHINQLGYRLNDTKTVIVTGHYKSFQVINADNDEIIFEGPLKFRADDIPTLESVYWGDFSEIKESGNYYISIPDVGRSYTFPIGGHVYQQVKDGLLKGLYYQRCGVALDEKYAGPWKHAACHTTLAYLYENPTIKLDVCGGWHDAGDYGRYTVPAAHAVADLMLAYELFPQSFKETIHIPESGNGVPDILNETRFELEWMMKMQDAKSGGVYHKVGTKLFCGFIMPEQDTADLYISPISSPATADFAAVMAMASRIYKPFDKTFSSKTLLAAEKAWAWLDAHPEMIGFRNPPDINTGGYSDRNDTDERFWAAVELYKTTGKQSFHDIVKKQYPEMNKMGLGWAQMDGFATISYLFMDPVLQDKKVYQDMYQTVLTKADEIQAQCAKDGYGISLLTTEYKWGSNMIVANHAMILIIANKLTKKKEYQDSALAHLHYLLGCNALNKCYVTGYGSVPVMHPHHRPSGANPAANPVPGLLSGGPNGGLNDGIARSKLEGQPPAKCYIDETGSFSTNEIAIYWNTPAVFLTGYYDLD